MMRQISPHYAIRPMEPGDIPAVVAIDRLSFPTPWSASTYLYELTLKNQCFYYVLQEAAAEGAPSARLGWRYSLRGIMGLPAENRIAGYMGFRIRSQHLDIHISTIAIHPDWRRNGLGELLLLTAVEKAMALEFRIITLEVRASNLIAQRLYQKYGFQFTGIHAGYYRDGEDAWLMEADTDRAAYRAQLTSLRRALEKRLCRQQAGIGQNDGDRL